MATNKRSFMRVKYFFKKNIFYILWVFALCAVIVSGILIYNAVNSTDNPSHLDNGGNTSQIVDNSGTNSNDSGTGKQQDPSEEPSNPGGTEPDDDEKPVVKQIIFALPVENATVLKNYTATTVVFNQTLNAYTGHLAIDYAATEGEEVMAVYAGVITGIETTYLTGTTITIDHGNNLKTVYNSIDALETLAEGQSVTQGEVIGYVANNNKQEYKDGSHLHFEVSENGKTIDPYKYLLVSDK